MVTLLSAFLLTVVLRLPSLFDPYWYVDEGVYLTGGQIIRRGLTLYRDFYDNKPPLIHYVAAITPSQFWFHFLGIILSLVTLYLFYRLSRRFIKNRWSVGLAVLLLAVIWNLPFLEGHTVNAEHFFVPLGMLAFLLLYGWEKLSEPRLFGAGTLLGLGFLFKFHAVFDLLTLLAFWFFLLFSGFSRAGLSVFLRRTLWLSFGFFWPLAASFAYFQFQGVLPEYFRAAFIDNFDYAGRWRPAAEGLWAVFGPNNIKGRLGLLFLFLSLLFFLRKKIPKETIFLALWFLFTLFGALLSARGYPHYLLPAVPPLLLLLAVTRRGLRQEKLVCGAAASLTAAAVLFFHFYFYPPLSYYRHFGEWVSGKRDWRSYAQANFGWQVERNYRMAQYVQERTALSDRIFIWSDQPHLYALISRVPAVPYLFIFQIDDLGKNDEVMTRLRQNPPKVVITFQKEPRVLTGLEEFLEKNYQLGTIMGDGLIWEKE